MPDGPSQLNAALSDRYAIERALGEGGMATVYLARDLKHNRHVALKVLKPELAAVVGAERFLAEIETTANLQHPNILPLYDSGEADSFLYYVMPYVEGETLRDRLQREKQLPVDEAVRIATAVANALDFAHGHGVVHRDIKPANILFQAGQPVVGDFGIALALGAGGGARLTETGLSVGTPYYMSPEQATGDQQVGARSDIYSLGCVLYEMLVGDPPYLGSTAQAVLGQIIAGKPVMATEKRSAVPANVDAAIRKALEKVPADRFATAAELATALGNPAFRYGAEDAPAAQPSLRRWKATALVAGVVAVAALAAGRAGLLGPAAPAPQVVRQQIHLSSLGSGPAWESTLAIGPHGGIVYEDSVGGTRQLFYKAADAARGTAIPGTEHPVSVAFSPTGDSIAFTQSTVGGPSKLIVLPLGGGVANTLATDADIGGLGGGLDWLEDGTILYETEQGTATHSGATISRVPADGSHPSEIVVKNQFSEAAWVQGNSARHQALVIYNDTLWVADLRTGAVSPQMGSVARAWYFPPRYVVYVLHDGSVFATGYDDKTGALERGGVRLFEGVRIEVDGRPDMDLGRDGTLIYAAGGSVGPTSWSLAWLDRKGAVQPLNVPAFPSQGAPTLALSPHDRRVAFTTESNGVSGIMVADLPVGPITRLTPTDHYYDSPMWTRDGRSLLFYHRSADSTWILRMRADGSTPRMDTLLSISGRAYDVRLTPDGRGVVYRHTANNASLPKLDYARFGSDSVAELQDPGAADVLPGLSPDGRWLAYLSETSAQSRRIFVRPFPDWTASRLQVSLTTPVYSPFWSRNRDELFYARQADSMLVAASFRTSSGLEVASRIPLFKVAGDFFGSKLPMTVDATGQRFLLARRAQSKASEESRLFMVLNWASDVRARLRGSH